MAGGGKLDRGSEPTSAMLTPPLACLLRHDPGLRRLRRGRALHLVELLLERHLVEPEDDDSERDDAECCRGQERRLERVGQAVAQIRWQAVDALPVEPGGLW